MDLTQFIENFASQFDDTEANLFTAETKFKDLDEWSSLIGLSVIMMVDEEYNVGIGAKEIVGSRTILDLFNKVSEKAKSKC